MDRICKTDSYNDIRSNRMYRIWCDMKTRCNNPKAINYHNYGGKGIKICEKWTRFKGFREDMETTYKSGLTLDRIDSDKGYYKENCRWVTYKQQARNFETNRWITHEGKTMIMKDWAFELGIKYKTLSQRINGLGWSYDKALRRVAP